MNSRSTKLFVVERSSSEPAIATVAIAPAERSLELLDTQLVSCPLTRHDCDVLGAYLQIAQRELVLAADILADRYPSSPLVESLRAHAGDVADYRARLAASSSNR